MPIVIHSDNAVTFCKKNGVLAHMQTAPSQYTTVAVYKVCVLMVEVT